MDFFISTNWNSTRHATGEALADECLALGFDGVELGYRLNELLAEGIRRRVTAGMLKVSSVHAYCPAPLGAPNGHPELYLPASRDADDRAMAVVLLQRSLNFAAEVGARAIVVHAGRVDDVEPDSEALLDSADDDGIDSERYQKLLSRSQSQRTRRVKRHLESLRRSLDTLLPRCAQLNVALCLENLPSIEAVPNEDEMLELIAAYNSPHFGYWHDMGHGQVRANLGWIKSHRETAERMLPHTRGLHIHDVTPPDRDHLPPGLGELPFADFAFYGRANLLRVVEPAPGVRADELRDSLAFLKRTWA